MYFTLLCGSVTRSCRRVVEPRKRESREIETRHIHIFTNWINMYLIYQYLFQVGFHTQTRFSFFCLFSVDSRDLNCFILSPVFWQAPPRLNVNNHCLLFENKHWLSLYNNCLTMVSLASQHIGSNICIWHDKKSLLQPQKVIISPCQIILLEISNYTTVHTYCKKHIFWISNRFSIFGAGLVTHNCVSSLKRPRETVTFK